MDAMSRRAILRGLLGGGCAICAARAHAAPLAYDLKPVEIAPSTWGVFGAREYFSMENGGNIVNTAFVEAPDGVIVIDSGPSRRYGEALRDVIRATVPGKPVVRVYNTHHHPDHVFGNQAFDTGLIGSSQGVIDNIRAEGEAFAGNMYRLVGDWMRGTAVTVPGLALTGTGEEAGGRRFAFVPLAGHTSADFAIRDQDTGVLFSGDLAFLDRIAATPHATLPAWRESLAALAALDHTLLYPGHGPADAQGHAIAQTRDWLDWLEGTLRAAIRSGLTMNEAMTLPIPPRFAGLGVARREYERSVVHLWPGLEDEDLPAIQVTR